MKRSQAELGQKLAERRAQRFVGRTAEVELFTSALDDDDGRFAVLFIVGPGGVGKSTLLGRFRLEAEQRSLPCALVDARDVSISPQAVRAAIGRAYGSDDEVDGMSLIGQHSRPILLIDTYEHLSPIDDWVRGELLPSLPEGALVVLAGREPPSPAWRTDPGWSDLLRVVSLRNLDATESAKLLAARGVEPGLFASSHAVTHGHPLALALVADLCAGGVGGALPELTPDVVRVLLATFVRNVPSPRHREALELAAHVRVTTDGLVRDVLGDDSGELFRWLRELSFVYEGPDGLYPHDLARDVLDADLRWRDSGRHEEISERAKEHYAKRAATVRGEAAERVLRESFYLMRHQPFTRGFYDWRTADVGTTRPARTSDRDVVVALAERHEGSESARAVAHWWSKQPAAFLVFEAHDGSSLGFMATLRLEALDDDDRRNDPGAAAAWVVLDRAPLRTGEHLSLLRFWIDAEKHHDPLGKTHHLVSMRAAFEWIATDGRSCSMLTLSDLQRWEPFFAHLDFLLAPESGFSMGGRRFGFFVHDWRVMPYAVWTECRRQSRTREPDEPIAPKSVEAVVLSQPDFAEAVRDALRDLPRTSALAKSPLLRSRLAQSFAASTDAPHTGATPEHLRTLIRRAADSLASHPKDEKHRRAVEVTYLRPAPTQEVAAERLGVPFSTYRRHLTRGVERIVEWLWEAELHGVPTDSR